MKHYDGDIGGVLAPAPPDGGWGWVVCAASFLCNMILDGIAYSFGVLLGPLTRLIYKRYMSYFSQLYPTSALIREKKYSYRFLDFMGGNILQEKPFYWPPDIIFKSYLNVAKIIIQSLNWTILTCLN